MTHTFAFRKDSQDEVIWKSVVVRNEYRLPNDLTGWQVVDIGAHIGSFSRLALDRNAAGLYNYGYRYYDTGLKKWLSKDPIGEVGGLNLYAFAENAGLNAVDWLGLLTDEKCCEWATDVKVSISAPIVGDTHPSVAKRVGNKLHGVDITVDIPVVAKKMASTGKPTLSWEETASRIEDQRLIDAGENPDTWYNQMNVPNLGSPLAGITTLNKIYRAAKGQHREW